MGVTGQDSQRGKNIKIGIGGCRKLNHKSRMEPYTQFSATVGLELGVPEKVRKGSSQKGSELEDSRINKQPEMGRTGRTASAKRQGY